MSNGFPEWWKHGQKVRTRRDGILTLNVAPDAEYWLTNDEGKEVYVFSADIRAGENRCRRSRPMSNIDKHALIAKIKKQTESFDTVVLQEDEANALLDELEAAEKRIAELSHHLQSAHAFIEHTEAFGYEASNGILCCGDAQWNIDASKSALVAAGKGEAS